MVKGIEIDCMMLFFTGLQLIRGWSDQMDTAFIRKGIDFDQPRGRFQITKSGIYVIYSHLVFRGPRVDHESRSHPEFIKLFEQRIYRQNPGFLFNRDQTLLEDQQASRYTLYVYIRFFPNVDFAVCPTNLLFSLSLSARSLGHQNLTLANKLYLLYFLTDSAYYV